MSWHLAPSLVQLRNEINAKYPKRSKVSDGSIGDASHSARVSDHNPNSRRSVNAIDITAKGIDPHALRRLLVKDSRVNYVIFNRVIYSRVRGFAPKRYTGINPHNHHLHVSILQSSVAENNTRSWGIAKVKGTPSGGSSWRTVKAGDLLRKGTKGEPVKELQKALGLKADSYFGADTEKALKAYQRSRGLTPDGIAGPKTLAALKGKKAPAKKPKKTAPKFPLPAGHWFGEPRRTSKNHSGFYSLNDRKHIVKIQKKLKISADGLYSVKTAKAVRAYQKKAGLKTDGCVGSATWAKLFK